MKKVILLAAFGALFASCKKDPEVCETWTYNELVKPTSDPTCFSFRESTYGLQKRFCGSELDGAKMGAQVKDKTRSTSCYDLYIEFKQKD